MNLKWAIPSLWRILPVFSSSCLQQRSSHVSKHILNENAIACGGVADHHVGDGTDELAVLDDTPIGVKGTLCPWCYALRLPTANRRGAICGIRPDKRASRCELP